MSWDLTIRSLDDDIGSLDAVCRTLSRSFPEARFGSEPSGIEKVRAAEAQGITFPAFIRENMILQPAQRVAVFESDGISLHFNFGSEEVVRHITLDVRGSGNPFPFLRRLVSIDGWIVVDDSTGQTLSAESQPVSTGWQIYKKMLNKAKKVE